MVFITHDISFPAQLLKATAPTHLQLSHSALSMETRSPPTLPQMARFIFQTLLAPHPTLTHR